MEVIMKSEKEENHQAAASDMRAQARRWSGLHGMMDIHNQTTSVLVFGQNNFTITRHFLTTNLMWHFWVFVEFVWARQNTHWESLHWDNLNPAQCYKCHNKGNVKHPCSSSCHISRVTGVQGGLIPVIPTDVYFLVGLSSLSRVGRTIWRPTV